MTKRAEAAIYRKLARVEETLGFISAMYTADQKAHATDFVMELEGERAYLHGLLGLEVR